MSSSLPPISSTTIASVGGALSKKTALMDRIIGGHHLGMSASFSQNASTSLGGTTRQTFTAVNSISRLKLVTRNNTASSGNEVAGPNSVIETASIECGTQTPAVTKGGRSPWVMDVNAAASETDFIPISIPAGTSFYTRLYRRVAAPPTSPSAASNAGGILGITTTKYYVLTTVDNGIESGPTAEFSGTTASTDQALKLTFTPSINGQTTNIYRSDVTSGTKLFIASVPITATTFTDLGYAAPVTGVTPPTQPVYQINSNRLFTGETSNNQNAKTDVTQATGAISGQVGPGYGTPTRVSFLIGDDYVTPTIVGLGTSILFGTGVAQDQGYLDKSQEYANWFSAGLRTAGGIHYVNAGHPSTTLTQIVLSTSVRKSTLYPCAYAKNILVEHGFNDIYSGVQWNTLATYHLTLAKLFYNQDKYNFIVTIPPRTTSTDGFLTSANQTIYNPTYNTQRNLYNNWVVTGCQVDGSGNPVQSGGTPSPYIKGYYHLAANFSADSAGNPVALGDYYKVPSAPISTGTFGAGSTATNLVSSGLTQFSLAGKTIKITSGALSGQTALILTNTSSAITVYAIGASSFTGIVVWGGLSAGPANGDAFAIYDSYTPDGIHPSLYGHSLAATSFATWATTNITV